MIGIDRRFVRTFDYGTVLLLALLLAIGIVAVASAAAGQELALAERQAVWAAVGLGLALVIGALDYRHLTGNAYLLWGLSLVALVAVLLFADREPHEFGLRGMLMPGLLVAAPAALVAVQPDMGTAATFLPPVAFVAFVAGLRFRTMGGLAAIGVVVAPLWYATLQDYQRRRLTSFLSPEADPLGAGYQLVQSKIAVGSGGLVGKGLFSGTQSQLNFLPEQENDFIMALMGEETGFVGVAVVLALYLLLVARILQGAYIARDRAGAFVCAGVAGLLMFHLAVNVGMVIGYVPITGIPLPLLSYGGSSAMATSLAVGLAISVRSRRFLV